MVISNSTDDLIKLNLINSALPAIILIAILGSISILSNVLVILTLYSQKTSIKNFSFNAFNLAVAECIAAIGALGVVSIRIQQKVEVTDFSPYTSCRFFEIFMLFGLISVNAQTFCLAFDRFLSVRFCLWYRNFCNSDSKRRRLYLLNITLWFLTSTWIPPATIFGTNENQYRICAEFFVYKSEFYAIMASAGTLFTLATVGCYVGILVCGWQQTSKPNVSIILPELTKTNQAIRKSVSVFIICQFCSWVVTTISLNLINYFDSQLLLQVEPYVGLLVFIDGILALPLYVFFIKRMRKDFVSVFKRLLTWKKILPINQ